MSLRDINSQLELTDVARRFNDSAGQRELVKEQIKLGMAPADIENPSRVDQRIADMGVDKASASACERSMQEAAETGRLPPAPPPNLGLERIFDTDDMLPSVFLERGAEASKSVCCILENGARIGTGFLVAPNLLLTNHHVIPSQATAAMCVAEFNFEDKLVGVGIEPTVAFRFAPDQVFFTSPVDELDYTLIAVETESIPDGGVRREPLGQFQFLPLDPSVANVLRGECLNILQHPNGSPKRVALRQNRFTALLSRHVHYETDTMPGSSGSPVFNDQWQVICLHHAGVPLKDSAGNVLKADNTIWNPDKDDPKFIKWIGNEGVRISRILADVTTQANAKYGDAWPEALSKFPRVTSLPPRADEWIGPKPAGQGAAGAGAPAAAPAGADGGVQGITISVQVGGDPAVVVKIPPGAAEPRANVGAGPAAAGRRRTAAPSPPPAAEPRADEPGPANLVERGLQNLERSKRRKYYDAAADKQAKADYYRGIDARSGTLREDLRALVADTHEVQLPYKVARIEHLYAWVDLQKNKKVRSVYSDQEFDPEHFIREDFTIERRLERLVERQMGRESNLSPGALELVVAALEAQDPFNCEHVVPQSWFGNAAPMQGDLHHLFSCESTCNSARGNRPYANFGKFPIGQEAVRPKCGLPEKGMFEPFMGKGKVARATLYFLLRYEGEFENMYDQIAGSLEMLLDWHRRSPVTEHEKHRNQAIAEIQKNRNPFIDNPSWAKAAFGA